MSREPGAVLFGGRNSSVSGGATLQLIVDCRAKQVAATLGISARTVEFHKYQMMDRLELHSSAELVGFAIKHGIVSI